MEFNFEAYVDYVDLIFIDGAHDYEHVVADTATALTLLSRRGVVLWHNYADILCPDVTRLLGELSERLLLFRLKNTTLAVYWRGYQ